MSVITSRSRHPRLNLCCFIMAASLAIGLGTGSHLSAAVERPISSHVLQNGMKVMICENHRIPNVALYLFVRTGSRNERPGITGISHLLEHMMFRGSVQARRQEFDHVMEKIGASDNAYTTRDVTVYSDWFPSSAVDLVLSLEAERFTDIKFDPVAFESERKVVLSEILTTVENDLFGTMEESLYASLYRNHPYSRPILGWKSDVLSFTRSDLYEYIRTSYVPSNCVMAIVGDISPPAILSALDKGFGSLPRGAQPTALSPAEPKSYPQLPVTIRKEVQAPQQLIAFRVPPSADPDYWPLQVASTVLTSGPNSRLNRRLVRAENLAYSVASWLRPGLDSGELVVYLLLNREASAPTAGTIFEEEMERLRHSLISDRELQGAKNKLLTAHALSTRTNSGMAESLGSYEVFFGGYETLFSVPARIGAVSTEDVRRVAQTYLVESRAVVTLEPTPGSGVGAAQ